MSRLEGDVIISRPYDSFPSALHLHLLLLLSLSAVIFRFLLRKQNTPTLVKNRDVALRTLTQGLRFTLCIAIWTILLNGGLMLQWIKISMGQKKVLY